MRLPCSNILCAACLVGLAGAARAQAPVQFPAPAFHVALADDSSARLTKRDTVKLKAVKVEAERVRRTGYAIRQTATAAKIDLPLLNTPQAVSVVGRAVIADQAMQGMADVVRYVPGITMGAGEGHRDAPTIRGNSSTADFFVDGVRDDAQYLRDVYNVERVEALKGPNALVFGRGGGGGVLNRVSKQAAWSPVRSVSYEGGSFDHRRLTLDLGGSRGIAAGRLNGIAERSGLTRGTGTLERAGVNPTVAMVIGSTVVRTGYEYFADTRTIDRGVPSFGGRPLPTAVDAYFGNADVSHGRIFVNAGTAVIERGSSEGVHFRNTTRLATYDKFYQNVYPGAVNAAGTQVALAAYNHAIDRHNAFNQADLSWAAGRGAVKQVLAVGAEIARQNTAQVRNTGYFGTATSLSVPVGAARVSDAVSFRQSASDADSRATANVAGAYLQEQLSLGSHVQAIAGIRFDRFTVRYRNNRNQQQLERTDGIVSPRAGLVLKPVDALSVYGSYSVSALPGSGDQFTALSTTTQMLEPERFTNREAGIKWEPTPELALSAAYYALERSNTSAPDPNDPSKVVQSGAQRTAGLELGVSGNVTPKWQVAGGLAAQSARITSRTSAAKVGATVPLVPRTTASLWNRYQLAPRLGAGLGVVHQAKMYAAIDNAVTLPAFTRLDGAAFVTLTRGVKAQLNVENLMNSRYYATSHGNNNIMPGAARTVRVSVSSSR